MDNDLEVFIYEAKQKNKQNKKKSVLEPHKKEIQKMRSESLTIKQIHIYLTKKYNIETSLENLRKWINRHIKKDVKIDTIDTIVEDKKEDTVKPFNSVREAYSKHKPLK